MGINLTDTTNKPGVTLTHGTTEAPGNFDNYTYTIDVNQFSGDPDDVITITGDWGRADNPAEDGWPGSPNGGDYVAAQIPNPSGGGYFGNLTVDQTTGEMSWSFTIEQLYHYAGQNYDVYFVGKYADQTSDSDLLKLVITCFIDGTMIATPKGEASIETLAIGDLVTTTDGRHVPVRWIGKKRIQNHVLLSAETAPVCVSAGALGNGLPHADLYLSADHGLIVDGMVVNAGALVNGNSIRFTTLDEMPAEFTYWHIETEGHDEILANGAPAETFVDYIGRKSFDNFGEYLALYGCERIIPEMKRVRISSRRQLPVEMSDRFGIPSLSIQFDNEADALMAKLAAA